MSNNPIQSDQEPSETRGNSFFSTTIIDLKVIVSGIIITAGGVIVTYIIQEELLKRYVSYEKPRYGIQLEYPQKWSIQENLDTLEPEVKFLSPQENNTDNFQEKVKISVENLSKPLSINEYTEQAFREIKKSNTIIEQPEDITFANREGRKIIYTGQDGMKQMKVWTIKNQKAYIATYTAEPDKFDKFSKQAEKIIESIKINI